MRIFAVINSKGLVFAGISSISGRAMWFDICDDLEHASSIEALRRKRDARWLAKALKDDATAHWKEF